MDVKSLLEKLLFDDVVEEVADEPISLAKPIESVKPIETIEPKKTAEPIKQTAVFETVEEKPVVKAKKALIDVTEVTYRPNYKTAASIEKAQYVRQEPISPIFGVINSDKAEEKKLTTPQFPANIEGSRKVESVLSPIFGKDIPEETNVLPKTEEVVIIEEPVEQTKEEVKESFPKSATEKPAYIPRHAEIKPEDNDVFYTNGLELDKIISLLNDPEENTSNTDVEDMSFLDSVITKKESDSDTISIFDDFNN